MKHDEMSKLSRGITLILYRKNLSLIPSSFPETRLVSSGKEEGEGRGDMGGGGKTIQMSPSVHPGNMKGG